MRLALEAISERMLAPEKFETWQARYPKPADFQPKNVGIVMAGNIPLVGFFDLLCVCAAGHKAHVKMSSKDRTLMSFAAEALRTVGAEIEPLTDETPLDAVITTGSDNTNRYFRERYGSIPHLLRGSRTSVAVLTGLESEADLYGLSHDVFDHFGMGCRSVSRIFVPEDYDVTTLFNSLKKRDITHPGYQNAYRHQKALLKMRGAEFLDGGFFTLRESGGFSEALPDLAYTKYKTPHEIKYIIEQNNEAIQCVVTKAFAHPRAVAFGRAQRPELWDYPDGKDVMAFLRTI